MSEKAVERIHHANLLVGVTEEAESYFRLFCKKLGFVLDNNPDFFAMRSEVFGIDEARTLRLLATRRALGERKIFFIAPRQLTIEAQNALLKTFEEPSLDTVFFLAVREEELLEPTLLSRMKKTRVSKDSSSTSPTLVAEKFLDLSVKDRMLFVKKFVDKGESLTDFLDKLTGVLRKRRGSDKTIEDIYNLRRFSGDPSVSPRLVLEHLALVL